MSKFSPYGEDDPKIEESIQSKLGWRKWGDLSDGEKESVFQYLKANECVTLYSEEVLQTIEYLNDKFAREPPGKELHAIKLQHIDERGECIFDYECKSTEQERFERMEAAATDFERIFLNEELDALVLRMLSKFAGSFISDDEYQRVTEAEDEAEQKELVDEAYKNFDQLADSLNNIFKQFGVNQFVTRKGFVPRQDDKITEEIYKPTLQLLASPKWNNVNMDLAQMFEDYREGDYKESIAKAHVAVQRFLQVLAGEEGKNSRGEVGKLFQQAKEKGEIPINRFTEPLLDNIKKFIVSERATNSTAKPSTKDATASDALLMMNVVMIFLQYCLQTNMSEK